MDSSANNPNAVAKTLAVVIVLSIVGVLVIASRLASSNAAMQERVLDNGVRDHLPIRVKIKKEKEESFKDLKNAKWVREFELEVTNTGDKPIYFLYIDLISDVKMAGTRLVFNLQYGRPELGDLVSKALPDDVPIKPKESIVLKFHPGQIPAWEKSVAQGRHPDATKLEVLPQLISFGDGTGYFGNTLYPPGSKAELDFAVKKEQSNRRKHKIQRRATSPPIVEPKGSLTQQKPATFLPVKFLSTEPSIPLATEFSAPQSSCMFPTCSKFIVGTPQYVCYNCPFQLRPTLSIEGVCKELVYNARECIAGTETYLCQVINVYDCGFAPLPTASPSSSSSPQPCQYCTDPNAVRPADCSDPANPKCDSFFEYQQNGCCYKQTCEHAGIVPPPPLPCPPGEFRSSNQLQPFPLCIYLPCIPLPGGGGNNFCGPMFGGGGSNPCECDPDSPECVSPILVDVANDGFLLSSSISGVDFDIRAVGAAQRISWTVPSSDDAWLTLDRNGNGTIDDGSELFGNFTPQPNPPVGHQRNGFLALAEYDKPTKGGNGDGLITSNDAIFASLRLWQDRNHNGVSEAAELFRLQVVGLKTIELDYKVEKKKDEHGNYFRYRAKVKGGEDGHLGRWAWDVFLVTR